MDGIRQYVSYPEDRANAISRRARLKLMQKCINAPLEDGRPGMGGVLHGPLVANSRGAIGVRCEYCVLVHRFGKEIADAKWAEIQTGPEPRAFGPTEMIPVVLGTSTGPIVIGARKGPRSAPSSVGSSANAEVAP